MKAGILEADRVVTVSPYYAEELVSGEAKGVELDNIIRKATITGIVNGMDVQEWNPSTDKYIGIHYNATTVSSLRFFFSFFKSPNIYGCRNLNFGSLLGDGCKSSTEGSSSGRSWVARGQEYPTDRLYW